MYASVRSLGHGSVRHHSQQRRSVGQEQDSLEQLTVVELLGDAEVWLGTRIGRLQLDRTKQCGSHGCRLHEQRVITDECGDLAVHVERILTEHLPGSDALRETGLHTDEIDGLRGRGHASQGRASRAYPEFEPQRFPPLTATHTRIVSVNPRDAQDESAPLQYTITVS